MTFYYEIYIISVVIWFLPLIKQRKTEYFVFFLILSLSDPFSLLFLKTLDLQANMFYMFIMVFQITALNLTRRKNIVLIPGIIITVLICITISDRQALYGILSFYILAVIFSIGSKFYELLNQKKINLFLSLLIWYYFISFFRFVALTLNPDQGIITFYTGIFVQFAFGIVFTFININTKNFRLDRKNIPADL